MMINSWIGAIFSGILLVGVHSYSDELPDEGDLLIVAVEPLSNENGPFVRNGIVYYREAATNINLMCIPPAPTDNLKWMREDSLVCRFEEHTIKSSCRSDTTIKQALVYESTEEDYEKSLKCKIGSDSANEQAISFEKILPADSSDLHIQMVMYPDTNRLNDEAEVTDAGGVVVVDVVNKTVIELRCSDSMDRDKKDFVVQPDTDTFEEFRWYHQGKLIKDAKVDSDGELTGKRDEKRFSFSGYKNYILLVNFIDYATPGVYVCKTTRIDDDKELSQMFVITGEVQVDEYAVISKNKVEGDEDVTVACRFNGEPMPLSVEWFKDGKELFPKGEDVDGIKRLPYNGVPGAKLSFDKLKKDDRANYGCKAKNDANEKPAEFAILLRVKDRLAALWPFIGICIEVLILVVIIFLYERRRKAKEAQEDADDADQTHALTANDQVRHRNV